MGEISEKRELGEGGGGEWGGCMYVEALITSTMVTLMIDHYHSQISITATSMLIYDHL